MTDLGEQNFGIKYIYSKYINNTFWAVDNRSPKWNALLVLNPISCADGIMATLSQILRSISLSLLFGGAGMIAFSAITLVRAAREKGMPVAEAAMNNAPLFINFSTIALVCAALLLIAEILDVMKNKHASKLSKARWGTSLIAIVAAGIFGFGIVPPMKQLLPELRTNEQAHEKFEALHKGSEKVFGLMMLCALASMLLPAFDKPKAINQ